MIFFLITTPSFKKVQRVIQYKDSQEDANIFFTVKIL